VRGDMSKMASVTILGGGLAGLSAGVELSANGIDVEVLEKQSDVGGLAKGFDHGDFIFDYGPHRFHTQKEWILERIKNIVGDDFLLRNRKSEILLQGKFYDYPVNAKNAVFSMGALKIMQIGIDYITTVLKNKISSKPDDSFESWVTNRYGKIMYSIFFGPYTEKVWGVHPSQLGHHKESHCSIYLML
jgi:protoporphyrinogen oxidase